MLVVHTVSDPEQQPAIIGASHESCRPPHILVVQEHDLNFGVAIIGALLENFGDGGFVLECVAGWFPCLDVAVERRTEEIVGSVDGFLDNISNRLLVGILDIGEILGHDVVEPEASQPIAVLVREK